MHGKQLRMLKQTHVPGLVFEMIRQHPMVQQIDGVDT
jgi:hypothetical protein